MISFSFKFLNIFPHHHSPPAYSKISERYHVKITILTLSFYLITRAELERQIVSDEERFLVEFSHLTSVCNRI